MKNKNMLLIMGILLCLMLFSNTIIFNHQNDIKEFNKQNTIDLNKFPKLNAIYDSVEELKTKNAINNETGCCSAIIHVKPGHDIVAYRRDSGYSADIIVNKTDFNGQNAIKEHKTRGGYFSHTIITENGWIINIGGRDDPNTNKQLEKLGSDIISRGNIENKDINKANAIIRRNGWGHFVIKSPDDNVGITAYDSRVSSSMTKLFKMKEGSYVKVPNNPRYYNYGKFSAFSDDPTDAAIKIVGEDIYGQSRKNVITYDYNTDNNSKKVGIWASFDGGALLGKVRGKPDNIQYMGNKIMGTELPISPNKKFLGEEILHKDINVQYNMQDVNLISNIQGTISSVSNKLKAQNPGLNALNT